MGTGTGGGPGTRYGCGWRSQQWFECSWEIPVAGMGTGWGAPSNRHRLGVLLRSVEWEVPVMGMAQGASLIVTGKAHGVSHAIGMVVLSRGPPTSADRSPWSTPLWRAAPQTHGVPHHMPTLQFLLEESDVGQNRAEASQRALTELNPHVTVAAHIGELSEDFLASFQVSLCPHALGPPGTAVPADSPGAGGGADRVLAGGAALRRGLLPCPGHLLHRG